MPKVKIVTDSSCGITEEEIKKYHITIVPLSVLLNDTVYIERESISNEEFINKMISSRKVPKTSQPPIGKFIDAFNNLTADGSSVVSINMLPKLSGTFSTAKQAAGLVSGDVTVIDSQTTDRGLAFQVLAAAELAVAGASVDEIIERVHYVRDNSRLYMGFDKLDNFIAGGRMKNLLGSFVSLLKLKIGIEIKDGDTKILTKGRGKKTITKFLDLVYQRIRNDKDKIAHIGISHVNIPNEAEQMANKIKELCPNVPILIRSTVPTIASHAGEGAFAIMYDFK